MKPHLIFAFIGTVFFTSVTAQQIIYENEYLINKYALNPAFTGHNTNFESFFSYRRNWLGVDNAPQRIKFSINGQFFKNNGIGLQIINDQIGIFRFIDANLSYAYHLKFLGKHQLSLGLNGGIIENRVDLSESTDEALADPVVMNNQVVKKVQFNASAGFVYRYADFNLGLAIHHFVNNKLQNEDAGDAQVYSSNIHYLIHTSYYYSVKNDWTIEPSVLFRVVQNAPLNFDIAVMVKYINRVWVGFVGRKNASCAISVGGMPVSRLVINYSYEFPGKGISGASSGSHEVTLGFMIGKSRNSKFSIFNKQSSAPYYRWMN